MRRLWISENIKDETMPKSALLRLSPLEIALRPFEKKLKAQEKFRRLIGVQQVDTPAYHRYLTGPVERFDSRRFEGSDLLPMNRAILDDPVKKRMADEPYPTE
jgi:hypothetical protein